MPGSTQKILTEIWHHIWLKNDGEKWSRKNYFEIPRWPSEITANLSGQFSLSGQIFLHWIAATLKAIVEFWNDFLTTFSQSFSSQKCCQISVRIFCVLSGTRNLQCTTLSNNCTLDLVQNPPKMPFLVGYKEWTGVFVINHKFGCNRFS